MPVATEMARVKRRTCQSMSISPTRGMLPAFVATRRRRPPNARSVPSTAPMQGEQNAFHDELLEQRAEAGADGGADGDLAAAGFGAGEQEVGDVDAGDQEDEDDGAEEDEHGAAHAFDDFVLEAGEDDRDGSFR